MNELSQEEIRRRRLLRLSALEKTPSSSTSKDSTPTPGPSNTSQVSALSPRERYPSAMDTTEPEGSSVATKNKSKDIMDVDSGIENMEVEESDRKEFDTSESNRISGSNERTVEQVLATISKILYVSWDERTKGTILLPSNNVLKNSTNQEPDYPDLISQSIMEVLWQFASGENPLQGLLLNTTDTHDTSPSSPDVPHAPVNLPPTSHNQENLQKPSDGLYYLMTCYARVAMEERNHPKRCSSPPLSDVLAEIRSQCVQFASLLLQGIVPVSSLSPKDSLLLNPLITQTTPRGFLLELVTKTHIYPVTFNKIFTPLLQGLARLMQGSSIVTSSHRAPLQVLAELTDIRIGNVRPLCKLLVEQIQFSPEPVTRAHGREISKTSFLAPFLSVSVFAEDEPKVAEKFFSGNAAADKAIVQTLQCELEHTRGVLYEIFHGTLVNSSSRDYLLEHVSTVLRLNEKRAQIQVVELANAGDGYMLNLLSVLQLLSVKVKLDKVDPMYSFHPKSLVEIKKDETRLRFTSQEVTTWLDELGKSSTHVWREPKFPTQCWFLTLHAHHLTLIPALSKYQRKLRTLRDLHKLVEEMSASEIHWKDLPIAARNKGLIKKWKLQIKKLTRSRACADAGLLDDSLLKRSLAYYSSVTEYLLELLCPGGSILLQTLPVQEVPPLFSALPEWYLEDIAEFLLFTLQFRPDVVASSTDDVLITWLLVATCSPHCIKNPYLVAKIIEVMFVLNPGIQPRTEVLYDRLMSHFVSKQYLPAALMKFYTDVETTGSSSEFYDKFTIRYHISIILKGMWESPVHRLAIIKESGSGTQFVKFVNMLMNDTTFLLDESLESLKRIHEIQELLSNPVAWAGLTAEQQQSKHRQLAADERQCRSYLTLARETVDMFHYLTMDIKGPFLRPELADRLSAMLNFNLKQLCGPKCKNLKVKTPEKYGWEPRRLLSQLADIYLHLDCDEFASALAGDERSFKKELLEDAALRMERAAIKTQTELEQFRNLAQRAADIQEQNRTREVDYSDAPDEFRGPYYTSLIYD
ncbi:hypothetical protein RUM44_010614 [Polyplax serrata]|uniref:Ubiquitin conjugation factor E4 core domain-containing protein n=1 Tax=Polyplax serrata TaxID=468196 RepID=A0ABR1AWN4_POLSC